VDFVDIDPCTYNLSVERLEEKLIQAEKQGQLPKIIIPVHLCGQSCDMAAIAKLSLKYGFRIIEDASHAVGGLYRSEPIGSCRYSDVTVFSFHPVKIVTTGEGGMVLTRSKNLADKMELFRSHGITRDPDLMTIVPDGPWYYQQIELGFNYRMTDIQAALGVSQMKRLSSIVERRQQLAARYDEALAGLPLTIPWQHPDTESARHLYVIRLLSDPGEGFHRRIFEKLRAAGIGVNLHYIPVYLQPYYQTIGFKVGLCPEAERYYAQAISLPLYYGLADEEQDEVVIAVTRAISS
jgi:dTDP-4-amino-4,6-dideoxygalactose transaminase